MVVGYSVFMFCICVWCVLCMLCVCAFLAYPVLIFLLAPASPDISLTKVKLNAYIKILVLSTTKDNYAYCLEGLGGQG